MRIYLLGSGLRWWLWVGHSWLWLMIVYEYSAVEEANYEARNENVWNGHDLQIGAVNWVNVAEEKESILKKSCNFAIEKNQIK